MTDKPKADNSWVKNLLTRAASAAVLIPIILLLLFWPKTGQDQWPVTTDQLWMVFCYAGVIIATWELMAMTQPGARVQQLLGFSSTVGVFTVLVFFPTAEAILAAMIGVVVLSLVGSLLRPKPIDSAGGRAGWLIAAPLYMGALLAPVALLQREPQGGAWVLTAMVLAFGSDTAAYFAGRFFGKHKLYEAVSPKKTIEGAIGGIIGATCVAAGIKAGLGMTVPWAHLIPLAVVGAALGQAGDLFESLIKRSTGVKDSGNIMPGHGGLLDRIDAFAFTASACWVYVKLLSGG